MPTRKKAAPEEAVEMTVLVSHLHFDPKNPRRDPMEDETEIRRVLCEDEGVRNLAAHIAENGLNPLKRVALLAHPKLPGHYIVPEGNRRLCASQLLRDPDRAPTPALKRYFANLKATAMRPMPDRINAVLFKKEDEARTWMRVEHEGEQGGIGTVQWGAREKARHNTRGATGKTRPKNPNRQAERILQYALAQGLVSAEQASQISLTTLTRYLPNVRGALALLNSEDCTTNADLPAFNRGIQKFLLDAIPPANKQDPAAPVNSRSDANERKSYAEGLRKEGASPSERAGEAYDPTQASKRSQAAAKKAAAGRGSTHPGKRKYLIPNDFVVKYKADPVLLRMVAEGKELNPDDARFSCNYIIRAVQERVIFVYAKKHCGGGQGKFQDVLQLVITHCLKWPDPPSKGIVNVLKKIGDTRSPFSYEQLGNGVHGGHIPSAADNRSNWESVQPALEYLLGKVK